ncbi:hypothetical protein MMC07_005763 [Pseudocyphellaria aurata]|nr:hypothetical protein [Pseudocyphellaria aurata]
MAETKGLVFLTGGNGFIACQILSDLIERDRLLARFSLLRYQKEKFSVVASVRSEAKGQEILELHPNWEGKVSFVCVSDLGAEKAFDHVFKDATTPFDFIIHTASPATLLVTDIQKELIDPAVQGTAGLLDCAHRLGGSQIKRFVLLGSTVAIWDLFNNRESAGPDYTEEDWNPVTAASAIESKDALLGYCASKKLSEEAAWQFIADRKPSFDLTVIHPNMFTGPMLQPVRGPENVSVTIQILIYNFMNGTYRDIDSVKFPSYHFTDIRDVSRAHIRSLTAPSASGQRIILVTGLITPQLVLNIIRARFPHLRDRVMPGRPDRIVPDGEEPRGWVTTKSFEVLGPGWKYRRLEESVVDTVRDLLKLETTWGEGMQDGGGEGRRDGEGEGRGCVGDEDHDVRTSESGGNAMSE